MKKLLIPIVACAVLLASAIQSHALVISTNYTTGGTFLLLSNRASIYNVTFSSDKAGMIEMFDWNNMAAPYYGTNYTNASYISRGQYTTNYVTSMVGYNGYTNYYTNAGLWTYNITNAAATNALSPVGAWAVGANTYATYNVDILISRGIVLRPSTNISVIINYRTGQ